MIFDAAVIAVVGVAKNCGKTTTLNALAQAAADAGKTVGLVSTGIDGERADVLLGTEKPAVPVRPGELVATARTALEDSTARVEYVESLGFSTPLGEAFVARVIDPGAVVLGGMRHRDDVRAAVTRLQAHGATQVWIDGAYGRVASAQPGLAEAAVVASGAIAGDDAESVADATIALLDRLTLPATRDDWERELIDTAVAAATVALGGPSIPPRPLGGSALVALDRVGETWDEDTTAIAVPGLVSDSVLRRLQTELRDGTLIVVDPTAVHASPRTIRRFRRGWRICARTTTRLLAISYNPQSVVGAPVSLESVAEILRRSYPKTPVFNPAVGLH